MHKIIRRALLATLLSGAASSAFAQEAPLAPAATDAAADVQEHGLSEVVVTARRREETAQSVPLAVSVIGGKKVEDAGVITIGKLQQLTPTFQYYSSNPRNTSLNIRGIGVPFGLTSDGFEQGVGVYVDDVYYARPASAVFDFLDLNQAEVLRGPQGTLYGKNTTAGAINITTNQPTFDFEGKGELSVGNFGYTQVKAAVSGPLTDTLAARLAISSTHRRGTIWNTTTKRWNNEQDNLGFRGLLLYRPSDDFKITFSGDYSRQNPECCAVIYVRTGSTQRALARQYAALAAAQNYAVPSTNAFDRVTDLDSEQDAGNKTGGASAKIQWNVGPGTFTSVTAWRFWDWKPKNDRDYLGLSIVAKSQNPSQQDQYSQEFRYNYTGQKLDFVVGAFAFKQRIDTQGTEQQGINASKWNLTGAQANDPSILNGLTALNTQWLKATSLALYSQVSWKVTDQLTIQPGVRLNYDKKSGFYERKVFDAQGAPVLFGQTDPIKVAQRGIYAPQLSTPSFSDTNFSYDITASYRFTPDVFGYATYAKTFKTGGINQNGLPADAAGNPIVAAGTIKPESVNHLEAGLKTQLWARRVTLNVAVFHTDIKNYQATVNNGQFGVLRGYLANAGKVRTRGVEVDFSARPNEYVNVYANGAYTDAKYVKFVDAPCPPELSGGTTVTGSQTPGAPGVPGALSPANCDISGAQLPGVSKWSFTFGGEAHRETTFLTRQGDVYFGVEGLYRSGFSSNPSPSLYTHVKGYPLFNFRAGFRTPEGWEVFGWVRNAFDEKYFEQLALGPSNTGLIVGQPGDPRTYGVTLRAAF